MLSLKRCYAAKGIIFLLFLLSLNAHAAGFTYPVFDSDYVFEYSGMKIGYGHLSAELKNGVYYLRFTGSTSKFISLFFSLKEEIVSAIDVKSGQDLFYESIQIRPGKKKRVFIKFDNRTTATVTYTKNSETRRYILHSRSGIHSPFYVYLFFLRRGFLFKRTYFRDVAVSTHLYRIAIRPVGVETINLDKLGRKKGLRKAIKVELRFYKMTRKGKLKSNRFIKHLTAWIDANYPYLPLYIKTWHIIGLVSARLTKLQVRKNPSGAAIGCTRRARVRLKKSYQAVSIFATSSRPSSLVEISLISTFLILPVTVIGNESVNLMYFGIL